MKTIVFTGGGTAGHVMPNLALIERMRGEWDVHYIGSRVGMERELVEAVPGVTYHGISGGKLRRYFSWRNFSDPFRVLKGMADAARILRRIRPDVVFSKGGYVSVPVVLAARGVAPVVAHESDYTPGLANRISAPFAHTICTTFEDTAKRLGKKGVFTGTPIRNALLSGEREKGFAFTGLSGEKPVLLVMGGSSGAASMNELVYKALPRLLTQFDVVHLCGRGKVKAEFAQEGYVPFEYIGAELPHLFAITDVILSRAGANAIFEFLALNKPTVLMPLPYSASRGDQYDNAKYFEKKGYARWIDQDRSTPDAVAEAVEQMYADRAQYIAVMEADTRAEGTDEVLFEIERAAAKAAEKRNKRIKS